MSEATQALALSVKISEMANALILDGTELVPLVAERNGVLVNIVAKVDDFTNRLRTLIATDPNYALPISGVAGLQQLLNSLQLKDAAQDITIKDLGDRLQILEDILAAEDGSCTLMADTWI